MAYQHLKLQVEGEVATLTLNRPPANLLNIDVLEELNEAVLSLRANKEIEVLLVRGSPTVFSEGMDLGEHVAKRVQRLMHLYMRLFESMRMMDAVQVAVVQGNAWGAGFEFALSCNLFVAADNTSFKLPETSYGTFPPIACAILPRVVPRRKAMEWILTGNEIDAQQLERFGLVNRILPSADFENALQSFVAELTSKSKPVLALAKRAQLEAYYATFTEAMSRGQSLYLHELMELEDARSGPVAHFAGRPYKVQNR